LNILHSALPATHATVYDQAASPARQNKVTSRSTMERCKMSVYTALQDWWDRLPDLFFLMLIIVHAFPTNDKMAITVSTAAFSATFSVNSGAWSKHLKLPLAFAYIVNNAHKEELSFLIL
jgi:hypothetical protein